MAAVGSSRFACKAAILAIAVAVAAACSPAVSAHRSLTITRAEAVARQAVLAHSSYRQITATRTGLVTRRCWRAAGAAVRCSLYVVAPTPCALQRDTGAVCAQALWERRWLVEVRRARHGAAARILKISSGPSGA
jgi:hypothetical protein